MAKHYCGKLIDAACIGDADFVRMLINDGVVVDEVESGGWTALMRAGANGRTDVVRMLIEAGADVNARNQYGMTALHWVAARGQAECLRVLLDAGADVNAPGEDGKTALMIAEANEHEGVIALLHDHIMLAEVRRAGTSHPAVAVSV